MATAVATPAPVAPLSKQSTQPLSFPVPKPVPVEERSDASSSEPTAPIIKHPLQHRWTLWYDCAQKRIAQSAWGDHLRRVCTVDSVEDFWGLYNNIIVPSQLALGANYHLFKEGIEPKWEDPTNEKGGKWLVVLPGKSRSTGLLDKLWLWALLSCIGEAYDDESEVCGCVISLRKAGDKLALWTKTATFAEAQKRIGRQLKHALELPDDGVIGYQSHEDCMKRNSSFQNKNKYEV